MYGLVTFQQVVPIHLDKHNQFKYHYTEIQIVIDSSSTTATLSPTLQPYSQKTTKTDSTLTS